MIDGIPINVETLTPAGLYILLMLLLFFERVVPIGRVRREEQIAEKWEAAYNRSREAEAEAKKIIQQLTETNALLTEGVGDTVAKVMSELQQKAGDST